MANIATIHERIALLVQEKADNKNTVLAQRLGVSEANIRGYIKGVVPKADVLAKIVTSYDDINPSWLLTGEGSMLKPSTSPKDAPGAAPSQSGESMGKDTKLSAISPRKAPKDAPTATTALMDYILQKDAVIAQKDVIIEQKNQEIMQLRCDGARLEAECRHLSAEVARLSSGLSPKPSPEMSPGASHPSPEASLSSSEVEHPSLEVPHPSSDESPDTPARS